MLEFAHVVLYSALVVLLGVNPHFELLENVILHNILQLFLLKLHEFLDHAFLVPEDTFCLLIVSSCVYGSKGVGYLDWNDEMRHCFLDVLSAMAVGTFL